MNVISRCFLQMKKIFLLSLLFTPLNAFAQVCGEDCIEQPSCADLGYKQTITCESGYITCPFDSSYKWCKEYTCEDGRYYSKALNSSDGYDCTSVKYHGLTCYECQLNPCHNYTFTSCPANANCSSCDNNSNLKYKNDSCKAGYIEIRNMLTNAIVGCTRYN